MKQTHDEEIVDCVMAIIWVLWIWAGACALGLMLTIVKVILTAFGIENNL
jgi:hypothetical protein